MLFCVMLVLFNTFIITHILNISMISKEFFLRLLLQLHICVFLIFYLLTEKNFAQNKIMKVYNETSKILIMLNSFELNVIIYNI